MYMLLFMNICTIIYVYINYITSQFTVFNPYFFQLIVN